MIKNKKFSFICIAVLCITYLLSAQSVLAETEPASKTDIFSDMDIFLQTCVKNAHIPSMSVTVADKDKVLFSESYGNCESCDTPFLLGSVSKSFTAVCIMRLSEQGKIDLNANISTYLPDSTDGNKITVRQLLNHTSGLGEHQTLENYRIINKQGTHNYANVNYSLLGKIIESVSGESYNDYINKNIFKPLGLSHTAASPEESLQNGLIDGYTNYWGFRIKSKHKYPLSENAWITVPAGYISSSANDLGKYLQMYLNGGNGIISEQSINTMFYGDTVYVEDDVPYRYGYGWTIVKEPLSETVLRHSGLIETGTSCIFILPESDIAVAVTANVNDYFVANNMMDDIGWDIILMLLGESPNEIKSTEYVLSHIQIDLIMLVILTAAIASIKIKRRKKLQTALLFILFYLIFPIIILLLVPIFFATPLWVAKAFVPDVFITVVVSSSLLFVNGIIKSIKLIRESKNGLQ
ncbi:MAG: beta-lactamase family protein [Oscillospiraceae bacterium]|nr:beta-lactamase family protein [Oscillospiraceae bacterium]